MIGRPLEYGPPFPCSSAHLLPPVGGAALTLSLKVSGDARCIT